MSESRTSYEDGMSLGEVKRVLETAIAKKHPHVNCSLAFARPDSYRGYYECVAFESQTDLTLGEMLASVEEAIGSTYHGYKGGEFLMDEGTETFIADYGATGWPLTKGLMQTIWNSQEDW